MTQYSTNTFTINIDEDRDNQMTAYGLDVLKDRYLLPNETPQQALARASCAFADNSEHAQRLYDYASKHWFMFSTPVLCNGGTERGLPISCFLNYVDDSCEGLAENYKEDIFLSRHGGGIGTYFGAVRSVGEVTSKGNRTTGVIPFIKVVDSLMLGFQQGSNRRGSCAVYLDINHPEIEEFLELRKGTGDEKRRARYLHHGLNIPDAFMQAVEKDLSWDLIDPNSHEVRKTVNARELWKKLLTTRVATGEPYLHFIDTSNRALPEPLKLKGLRINTSNLCNEIMLPTSKDRTAVCCLSSVNLVKYDEWQNDALFIEDLIRMLDNVLESFIQNAPPELWRAVNSAKSERSLGLGAMGFHTFLQEKNIPFESAMAAVWNKKMFQTIYHNAEIATKELAQERGEAPDMVGTGRRNAHLMAVAPNATSSIICGEVSASIEPISTNLVAQKTLTGTSVKRNESLVKVLKANDIDNDDTWAQILSDGGSVKNVVGLSVEDKAVFKTAFEINQSWIIEHAATRQKYIDQGQSVNVFFSPDANLSDLHKVHKDAWSKGLKGLYYVRSFSVRRADTGGVSLLGNETDDKTNLVLDKVDKNVIQLQNNEEQEECLMCQG